MEEGEQEISKGVSKVKIVIKRKSNIGIVTDGCFKVMAMKKK